MVAQAALVELPGSPVRHAVEDRVAFPSDWTIERLPKVIWFQEGPGLRKWQFRTSGMKVINVTNLQSDGYLDVSNTDRYISLEEFEKQYQHFGVDADDIVVASSGNSYCKTARVREQDLPLVMNTSVIRFKPSSRISHAFMYAFLRSPYFKEQIDAMITGGAQPNFGPFHLKKILVPLPPNRNEQEAIAQALSDADAQIESLETLIAKKTAMMQGVMQDLLSGRKRLPGFGDEWRRRTFREVFDFFPTATNSRADLSTDGDAYYVHYGDIHTRFHSHLDFTKHSLPKIQLSRCSNAALLKNGDWIMADASEDYEGVGKSIEVSGLSQQAVAVSGLHTFLLREKNQTFAPGFKGHLGNSNELRRQFLRVMTGMKVFGVSKSALKDLFVPIPEWSEQVAIGQILNDLNSDLDALDAQLGKARQIKQGMMQELLTGRVRLI